MRQRLIVVSGQVMHSRSSQMDSARVRVGLGPSIEAFARFHVLAGANPGIVKTLDDKRIEVTCRNHRLQRRSRFLVHPGARQLEGTLRIRLPESTATEKQKR